MKEQVLAVVRSRAFQIGSASALSFAAGAGGSYYILKGKLEAKYAQIAKDEIAESKRFYARLHKDEEFSDPADLPSVKEFLETKVDAEALITEQGYRSDVDETIQEIQDNKDRNDVVREALSQSGDNVSVEASTVNVFVNDPNAFDYESEMRNREGSDIYVITLEEFLGNEKEFDQVSLTYFDEDDVLVDSADQRVDDRDPVIGPGNVNLSFGYGSKDENVVYIRNNTIKTEFEISKSDGSYTREVLGYIPPDELEHSERPRKFRSRDG